MKTLISILLLCAASPAFAGTDHEHHKPAKVSPEFESMKALVGTWEGKTTMNGKEMPVKVEYTLTSGGTALMEKMDPGGPMEMVTVYASNGKKINATHFCAVGNQPEMALKSAKDNVFTFEMAGTKGISSKDEMHMHGVKLTLSGNTLKQEWTNFNKGKKADSATFEFTKKM
jgi:hypothetical protein